MSQSTAGKYYLGRKVVDNYGRTLGKVVGYYVGEMGSPPLLGVELLEGDFNVYPSTNLVDEANILVLNDNWKTKADTLSHNLNLSMRKISALEKLYKTGEISNDAYQNLGKEFENTAKDLRVFHESLVGRLDERSHSLSDKLKQVEDYFVNIKVAYELGEIDDDDYKMTRDALHDLINRLQTEQKDVSAAQERLRDASTFGERTEYSRKPLQDVVEDKPPGTPIVLRIKEAEE